MNDMIKAMTNNEILGELLRRLSNSKDHEANEQKLLEEIRLMGIRLHESERVKSDFLSNIRNELVNPLSAILGLSQAILKNPSAEQIKACAGMMYREAFDLDYQMRNLFAAAEIEAGGFHDAPVYTNASAIVAQSLSAFEHNVKAKYLKVVFEDHLQGKHVIIDPALFQLLFNNILANAIEFSFPSKEIFIRLVLTEEVFLLTVKDDGIGIDRADHEKIFHRFRQLDSGTKKLHRGQGLGLSIVQECAETMGATMRFESVKNNFTEFNVSFPVTTSQHLPEGISSSGNDLLFDAEEIV